MTFRTYPYTSVRVMAMRSQLLRMEDYLRMRKMGTNEIIRHLAERQYRREIEHLSKYFKGLELINLALNVNLGNTVNKLQRIALRDEVKAMIRLYALKWVVNNLKIVIRVKLKGLGKEHVRYGVVSMEPMTYTHCRELHKAELPALARAVETIMGVPQARFIELYGREDLKEIENMLDLAYYRMLHGASQNVKNKLIREFLSRLVELVNIRNIMKLRAAGLDPSPFVIGRSAFIAKLLSGEAVSVLRQSRYAALAENVEQDPANLENNIEKFLLQYSSKLLHEKPLSIAPIFGYLLAKEIEIRNIRLLVNANALRVEDAFVERNLIAA